jgi:hypothetical protein
MKFTVTEFIKKYMKVGDDYQYVEVEKKYSVNNWDDLATLLMSIIDFSDGPIKFEVRKEAVDEQ